jgi:hypothetical protein
MAIPIDAPFQVGRLLMIGCIGPRTEQSRTSTFLENSGFHQHQKINGRFDKRGDDYDEVEN